MKIVYKILVPVIVLGIFALFFFAPMFHISVSSSLAGNLSENIGIPEYTSVYDFVKMSKDMDETRGTVLKALLDSINDPDSTLGSTLTNVKYLKMSFVAAALLGVFLLATAVVAAATKKYLLTTCLSACSLISGIVMKKLFDAFAKPFLTGRISLSSFLSGSDATGIIGSLFGSLAKVEALELAWAYQAINLLLIGLLAFTGIWFIKKRFAE